ncbi:MAG: hypothetical protein HPY82_19375 [Gammaproteobacteria bacterium]|nr:hypothetical protein [Gammaproteobacteria bacterium]
MKSDQCVPDTIQRYQEQLQSAVDTFLAADYAGTFRQCEQLRVEFGDEPEALNVQALALVNMQYPRVAKTRLLTALALNPDVADYWLNLAEVHLLLDESGDAIRAFQSAHDRAEEPEQKLEILIRLAETQTVQLMTSAALPDAISADPESGESMHKHFTPRQRDELSMLYDAKAPLDACSRLIELWIGYRPSRVQTAQAMARALLDEGRGDEAYRLAQTFHNQEPGAQSHNLVVQTLLMVSFDSRQAFYDESVEWARRYQPHQDSIVEKFRLWNPVWESRDLRIGILCDYADTVFGKTAIFPLVESFTRYGFQVFFYNFGTTVLKYGQPGCTLHNIRHLSPQSLHDQIVADQVTVLLDLNGRLRDDQRLAVAVHRSAPVQMVYMNLRGTTGIADFDFTVSDDVSIPVEEEKFYVEKIIRLPCKAKTALQFERLVPVTSTPALTRGYVTYCSFNAFFKFNEQVADAWSTILTQVPGSHLYLKCEEFVRPRVRARAKALLRERGISADRLRLEGPADLRTMQACYADGDIALDPFPYCGGSTTMHALWQGVPVLTYETPGWRGTATAAFLHSIGRSDWISTALDDYVNKAVAMASDVTKLDAERQWLAREIHNCAYFNPDLVYTQLAEKLFEICHLLSQQQFGEA